MDEIDLRRQFEKETGRKAVVINQYTYPTEQYFKWLEDKLIKNLNEAIVKRENECVHQKCGLDNCPHIYDNKVVCFTTRL